MCQVTKASSIPSFKIGRGGFQDDTLSPNLFLIAFHHIIAIIFRHPKTRGSYSLLLNQETVVGWSNPPTWRQLHLCLLERRQLWWKGRLIYTLLRSSQWMMRMKLHFITIVVEVLNQYSCQLLNGPLQKGIGNGIFYQVDLPFLIRLHAVRFSKEHKLKGFVDNNTFL